MGDDLSTGEKRMRLRFDGTCRVCDTVLPAKAFAVYERTTRTVRCVEHDDVRPVAQDEALPAVDVGTPGASARREFERRKDGRENRLRSKHPKLGGLLHALSDEPQSTTAWATGATGEERLGGRLSELASDTLRVLHDRRMPRSRANIDHLAVTSTGVYVIDAKKYVGRPRLKVGGGVLRPRTERLVVGTRDCSSLVDGVLRQTDAVAAIAGGDVPVHPVLCFVEADWPIFGGSFVCRDVAIVKPRSLYPSLQQAGAFGADAIEDLHRRLAAAFPPA